VTPPPPWAARSRYEEHLTFPLELIDPGHFGIPPQIQLIRAIHIVGLLKIRLERGVQQDVSGKEREVSGVSPKLPVSHSKVF